MSSTSPTLKFKKIVKDQLFYNQYEYCFGFTLAEANAMRGLKHDLIDSRLDQRVEWREVARQRWQSSFTGWRMNNEITQQIRQDLHTVCNMLTVKDCKLVVSTNFGWIYTNDLELIDQLRTTRCLTGKTYTQAVINRPKNTIQLKNSLYSNRSYFYNIKLTLAEKENLQSFFTNQKDHVRISPSFTHWLYEVPYLRVQDYYFFDYDGEQWLTMLSLIRPGLIRKTLKIITK